MKQYAHFIYAFLTVLCIGFGWLFGGFVGMGPTGQGLTAAAAFCVACGAWFVTSAIGFMSE